MAVTRLQEHLFRYGGHIGAALIIGGYDIKGPRLVSISPGGNTMDLPYQTVGSGSLAAMSIMETQYHDKLTEEEAFKLVVDSIEAGIYHDLGSGSNVDVCIIKKDGCKMYRNFKRYLPSLTNNITAITIKCSLTREAITSRAALLRC